ncbi:LacI family DNA-binding transcriptional regulator [Sphingobacterium hungaricum]|uniref:LacI family transcriptional regulator n=1 Tax=Sphingobacterium hungaricum TaxID=2082723 RepID=A0A928YQH2_9SPHI|nr:LacI family DNA-binding transcriptional regulator [Sphingobacterium hungaricum]MBE8714221.1 LacI family transcriptional regulator [Sphingobacterium hungaricum]
MKKKRETRVTITDLAEELNLSASTISRALANHPGISEATKRMVNEKAEKLGFTPNSIASSFRSKKTKSLGVIVPRIDIDFHSRVISGIEEFAYKTGYHVTIFQSQDSYKREKEIVKILQTKMVEGIIMCLAMETKNYDHLKKLTNSKIPLVFYDRTPDAFETNKVMINDFESAYVATEHLIQTGCKRLAHIAGNQSTGIFRSRLEGFKAALKANDLPIHEELIKETANLRYEEGVKCANELLELDELPDGVFCANDYTAASMVQVLNKHKISIPDQVAVVGFSDYPISKIIEPNLTTINDRAFQMGEAAAKLLIGQIEDSDSDIIDYQIITLKTELVIRESTKGIAK